MGFHAGLVLAVLHYMKHSLDVVNADAGVLVGIQYSPFVLTLVIVFIPHPK